MKKKILVCVVLAGVILCAAGCDCFFSKVQEKVTPENSVQQPAPDAENYPPVEDDLVEDVPEDIPDERPRSVFGSYSGVVTGITDIDTSRAGGAVGGIYALTEAPDGSMANLIITGATYFAIGETVKAGDRIIGFYDVTKPMLMIYPPQPQVLVAVVNLPEGKLVSADYFDGDLTNADGTLQLFVSGSTEIVTHDGLAYSGDIRERSLVVFYDVATDSIPAQTVPTKIVVYSGAG